MFNFGFVIHDLANIVTFCLSITYIYWTIADAQVIKEEHFRKLKILLEPKVTFDFLNVHPLSPGGFFTFSVAVAHGAPSHCTLLLSAQCT